jgi:hypothetical protein
LEAKDQALPQEVDGAHASAGITGKDCQGKRDFNFWGNIFKNTNCFASISLQNILIIFKNDHWFNADFRAAVLTNAMHF